MKPRERTKVDIPEPLVELDQGGRAAVIGYNIPEPTSYSGRHFIDLPYPTSAFVTIKPSDADDSVRGGDPEDQNRRAVRRGGATPARTDMEAGHILPDGLILAADNQGGPAVRQSDREISSRLAALTQADLARASAIGRRLAVYEDISGQLNYRFIAAMRPREPSDPWEMPVPPERGNEPQIFPFVRIMLDGPSVLSLSGGAAGVKFSVSGTYVADLAFVQKLTIFVDRENVATFDPVDQSTWHYGLPLTSSGRHVISIVIAATDRRVGYTEIYQDSVSLTVNVTLDVAAPAPMVQLPSISVTTPASTTTIVDPTGIVTVQLAGKAAAFAPATLKLITIRDELSGKEIHLDGLDGKESHDWTAQMLLDKPGSHRITATVVDSAGNSSPAPAEVTLRLLTSPRFRRLKSRLMLVETLNLSSFLGNFGAGRVIKTFSLLPGEKSTISVKTWTKTTEEQKSASSILDSSATESADTFEDTLAAEQTHREAETEAFNYKVSASAGASWGWGSASINAEASGSANSAREEAVKNVSSATRKHALKASSNRTVTINTEYKSSSEVGTEESTVREVANVNVSRTLNFVFRQVNQEFITMVHLTNVRVGFYAEDVMLDENGEPAEIEDKDGNKRLDIRNSYREVSLPELDTLLAESVNPAYHSKVREAILNAMSGIPDWQDNLQTVFEDVKPKKDGIEVPGAAYVRFKRHLTQTFSDPGSTFKIDVPGVILSYDKIVMRTDGVLVDTILGGGNGLDKYSSDLQELAVEERRIAITEKQAEIDRQALARKIIADGDEAAAALFALLFPPPAVRSDREDLQ